MLVLKCLLVSEKTKKLRILLSCSCQLSFLGNDLISFTLRLSFTFLGDVQGLFLICNYMPFLSPGDLPNPGPKPGSPALLADSLPSEQQGKPYEIIGLINLLVGFNNTHFVKNNLTAPCRSPQLFLKF